jgi:hypothetical protein
VNEPPLAIDLCCGLGGWTEGLLAEGWQVRGYDIEAHEYGEERYPAELVLRNLLEMHGSEIADADLIVASPPCTEYSYMAMPWSRAKQIARALRGEGEFPDPYRGSRTVEDLNALFDACFRIQREASEAAGQHIPMVVENVRGAIPWVGRSRGSFGSFHLWGDVPALMPKPVKATKNAAVGGGSWFAIGSPGQTVTGGNPDGRKVPSVEGRRTDVGKGARFTSRDCGVEATGVKQGGDWFAEARKGGVGGTSASFGSKSPARKRASALIAKIPEPLARHIGLTYWPADHALAPTARAA